MSVSRFLEVAAYYAGYGAAFNGKIRLSPFAAADRPDDHDAWLRGFDDARAVMARNVAPTP